MAARLPDGSTVYIATGYDPADVITGITNASPAIATATAHGLSNGDYGVMVSGWNRINEKVVRISNATADTFALEGIDTSDTNVYPAASLGAVNSIRRISQWTQITQILSFEMSGGDQQFATFSFLEEDFERQLPTVTSARSVRIGIADDKSLPGWQALAALEGKRPMRALRLNLPDGSVIVYNGVVTFNSTPTLNKGSVMEVSASFSLQGTPTRY